MTKTVTTICGPFDLRRYQSLRRAYGQATMRKAETFDFEGHEYLVNFVKYLLQFLEGEFRGTQ